MNNKNKESISPWVFRLFKQLDSSLPAASDKPYYTHQYHNNLSQMASPFGALFYGAGQSPGEFPSSLNFQKPPNTHVAELAKQAEISQTLDSTLPDALNGQLSDQKISFNNAQMGHQLTVVNSYDETHDTKTFHLADQTGRSFSYLPGQYITLSTTINSQEYKRSYSLASTPSRPHTLAITVKRASNGGIVSNWLNDNLKIGDTVAVKGPFGKFSCVPDTPQKILLLAAGSGIVPIMSMLRWLTDTDTRADVALLLSFRTLYDIIFSDELNLIATRHKNIKLQITLTKEPLAYSQWLGLAKRVDEKTIANAVPDVQERAIYLCGPDAFMAECKQFLQNLAVPTEQIFCESFTVNSPQAIEPAKIQQAIVGRPSGNSSGNYRVRFAKSGKTITANGQVTLLELAEQSGIRIDHECRSGNCGECMIKCLKGRVEMTGQAEIDDNNRKKGWVYSCCAYPASNVVLEI